MVDQEDVRRIALSLPGTSEAEEGFAFSVANGGKQKGFAWGGWSERGPRSRACRGRTCSRSGSRIWQRRRRSSPETPSASSPSPTTTASRRCWCGCRSSRALSCRSCSRTPGAARPHGRCQLAAPVRPRPRKREPSPPMRAKPSASVGTERCDAYQTHSGPAAAQSRVASSGPSVEAIANATGSSGPGTRPSPRDPSAASSASAASAG